jgi:hypothetical protein
MAGAGGTNGIKPRRQVMHAVGYPALARAKYHAIQNCIPSATGPPFDDDSSAATCTYNEPGGPPRMLVRPHSSRVRLGMTVDSNELPMREIDDAHARAQKAFQTRDLRSYMEIFTPDLTYRQPDGQTIDRDTLRKDVARQFKSITAVRWRFARESFEAAGNEVSESLIQTGWIASTAFGILHRLWHLERRGLYTWRRTNRDWQISAVEVHSERVVGAGLQLGWRPRLPASDQVPPKGAT